MAVPMIVRDRVTGVITLMGKPDGFTEGDQGLLAVLAMNAAVMVENFRLLNLTDPTWISRLEKLELFQQIDRQLNASA